MKIAWLLCASTLLAETVLVDGKKIFYRAEGNGKETILFIHGWSCNETFFLPQREGLSKSYRVIALDLPGHGKSESFDRYSIDLFVRAVEAVRVKENAGRPWLVAHSMGAVVAREFGKKNPGLARGFVFVDGSIFRLPPDEAGRERWKQMMENLAQRFSPALEKQVRERNVSEFLGNLYADATPTEFRLMILGQILQTRPTTSEGAFRALADLKLWDDAALAQPVLFLRAGRQAPPGEEQYLRGLFPQLRYKFVPGVSHFLQLERPDEVTRDIAEFLRSVQK